MLRTKHQLFKATNSLKCVLKLHANHLHMCIEKEKKSIVNAKIFNKTSHNFIVNFKYLRMGTVVKTILLLHLMTEIKPTF